MNKYFLWILAAIALSIAGTVNAALEPPKVLKAVNPDYSAELKKAGVSGRVLVQVTISETGEVAEAEVVDSPHEKLSEAALASIRQWRFEPAKKDGKPIAKKIRLPIDFQLTLIDRLVGAVDHTLFVDDPKPLLNINKLKKALGNEAARKAIKPAKQTRPIFPKELQQAGVQGRVMVEFTVDPKGNVINPGVLESPDDRLQVLALFTIVRWKWEPILVDGKPVNVLMRRPILFGPQGKGQGKGGKGGGGQGQGRGQGGGGGQRDG